MRLTVAAARDDHEDVLDKVRQAMQEIQYGRIVVTMQGGKAVMVTTERQERVG